MFVPALRRNERALLRQIGIPATALFALGTGIGLFFLTPFTFRLLFLYVAAMRLKPVLRVRVPFHLRPRLFPAFGVVFELPVFVYALTTGSVSSRPPRGRDTGAARSLGRSSSDIVTPDNLPRITMLLMAMPESSALSSRSVFHRAGIQRDANSCRGAVGP